MTAFEQLHPAVQAWVWQQGWHSLRRVQEAAIPAVLAHRDDVLIMAPTAGGKTEAAFLPAISHVLTAPADGLRVLCVSPLRALITDQARRLQSVGEACGIRVQPWHSDVSSGKQTFWKRPAEIILITPESLEAMLMHRAGQLAAILKDLSFVIIDELHAFFGSPRGVQMQSLLHRVDLLRGGSVPRIGLSATLGDIAPAAEVLRRGRTTPPVVIRGEVSGGELKLAVKAFVAPDTEAATAAPGGTPGTASTGKAGAGSEDTAALPRPPESFEDAERAAERAERAASHELASTLNQVASHLFERTRGKTALIFANARAKVELLTDAMVSIAEQQCWPIETFAHHGSLGRDHRIDVEERLRKGEAPTQVVCTSTLELGIDIGDVRIVGQVGPAPSSASLKQRVGRSGRRVGEPQILRQCVELRRVTAQDDLLDRLHLPLIQSLATIECLLAGEYETPNLGDLHLSTLIQQILSRVIQGRQGETAATLFRELCGPQAAFSMVDKATFIDVLRALGDGEVLEQTDGGLLLPGRVGELLSQHYSFYATFHTPEEFLVLGPEGKRLGTIPLDDPLREGELLVYAGRRWRVDHIDPVARIIKVSPGAKGRPPLYSSVGLSVSRCVQQRMKAILAGSEVPPYLDQVGAAALAAARGAYACSGAGASLIVGGETECEWYHFQGSKAGATLAALLADEGIEVGHFTVALRASTSPTNLRAAVEAMNHRWPASSNELVDSVSAVSEDKFDHLLTPSLLARRHVSRHVDLVGAAAAVADLLRG